MQTLARRLEAKVERSGTHHLWVGSKNADGTGKLKVDGKIVTAAVLRGSWSTGSSPAGRAY